MRPFNLTYLLRRTTKTHAPTDDTIAKIDRAIAITCVLLVPSFFSALDTSPCSPVTDIPFAIVVRECGFQLFHRLSIQQFLHLYIVDMHPKLFLFFIRIFSDESKSLELSGKIPSSVASHTTVFTFPALSFALPLSILALVHTVGTLLQTVFSM